MSALWCQARAGSAGQEAGTGCLADLAREHPRRTPGAWAVTPPFTVGTAMAVPLAELSGWWLAIRCECGQGLTDYPLRLMLTQQPRLCRATLRQVLPRLRCRYCHGAPARVQLVDDPQRRPSAHSGIPPGGSSMAVILELPLSAHRPLQDGA